MDVVKRPYPRTRLLVGVGLLSCSLISTASAEILSETFDDLEDWTSTLHTTKQGQKATAGDILPGEWDGIYQGTQWSPEKGYPDHHASLEILAANRDKARGGEGKSAVFWRESHSRGWKNWASDAQMVQFFPGEFDEVYAEFWIRFSDDWYGRKEGESAGWTSKIFRVGHWNGEGGYFNGAQGNVGPLMIWDWKRDNYGVRNVLSFRGGPPQSENYHFRNTYAHDGSLNFKDHTSGMGLNGEDPLLPDRTGDGYVKDTEGMVDHDQVFGPPGDEWTKVAFYVKINSAPDKRDGVFRQWFNDVQVRHLTDVPWIMESSDNRMVGWNYLAIGGNDYFQQFPNEDRYEDWYAIDDLRVMEAIPSHLTTGEAVAPMPPLNLDAK